LLISQMRLSKMSISLSQDGQSSSKREWTSSRKTSRKSTMRNGSFKLSSLSRDTKTTRIWSISKMTAITMGSQEESCLSMKLLTSRKDTTLSLTRALDLLCPKSPLQSTIEVNSS
jgi:hypothetical protein